MINDKKNKTDNNHNCKKKNEKTYDWYSWSYTLPKFNIAAEKLASQ